MGLNSNGIETDKPLRWQCCLTFPHDDRQSVSIHPLALVSPESELGTGVTVAAFATIEAGVTIGENCSVGSGSVSLKPASQLVTTMKSVNMLSLAGNHSTPHARRPLAEIVIGNHNVFREGVSIHRALKPDGQTAVGDHQLPDGRRSPWARHSPWQ